MNNILTIEKTKTNNCNQENISLFSKLKSISNDSLFYFAIFFSAVVFLQFLPFFTGLFENYSIGINEVVVSVIGFANVFFLQVYNKIFKISAKM
ncbi:MAG: hypothetical protein H6610_09690 [Ignavibacteriales bacterium]|nr:hypothetical protein [Ignavibacteriales bacterium]MCB9210475.1 hypothetical protein [Ignavibacteriales bacterium]MCB9219714.1 hypothetical protein [Ignavibacteriales bacterium]